MLVTLSGMVRRVRLAQDANAQFSILVRLSGRRRPVSLVHDEKALLRMVVRPSGRTISGRLSH